MLVLFDFFPDYFLFMNKIWRHFIYFGFDSLLLNLRGFMAPLDSPTPDLTPKSTLGRVLNT